MAYNFIKTMIKKSPCPHAESEKYNLPPFAKFSSNNHSFRCIYKRFLTSGATSLHFFREFLEAPARVGSICPSSQWLAENMARQAYGLWRKNRGLVIDLGAGNGIVTSHLLKNGISPNQILGVEISRGFSALYKKNFPEVRLITEDALSLPAILLKYYPHSPIAAIVSSLPFRALPENVVAAITTSLRDLLLCRGGVLIQFTYALWLVASLEKYRLRLCDRTYVFQNIPPAMVETYLPAETPNS